MHLDLWLLLFTSWWDTEPQAVENVSFDRRNVAINKMLFDRLYGLYLETEWHVFFILKGSNDVVFGAPNNDSLSVSAATWFHYDCLCSVCSSSPACWESVSTRFISFLFAIRKRQENEFYCGVLSKDCKVYLEELEGKKHSLHDWSLYCIVFRLCSM